MRRKPHLLALLLLLLTSATRCVQSNTYSTVGTELNVPAKNGVAAKPSEVLSKKGIVAVDRFPGSLVWNACAPKSGSKRTIAVFDFDIGGGPTGCDSIVIRRLNQAGHATVILSMTFKEPNHVFDVVLPALMDAVQKAIITATAQLALSPPAGTWGYGDGAIVAGLFAREKKLPWTILGGGAYDLAEAKARATDMKLRDRITATLANRGQSVIEEYSLAYNTEGMPKKVFLYHAAKDNLYAPHQSEALRETLAAAEIEVYLQMLPEASHDLSDDVHSAVLVKALSFVLGEDKNQKK